MPVLPRIPTQVPRKINAKHTQERTGKHRKRTQKNNSRARVVSLKILACQTRHIEEKRGKIHWMHRENPVFARGSGISLVKSRIRLKFDLCSPCGLYHSFQRSAPRVCEVFQRNRSVLPMHHHLKTSFGVAIFDQMDDIFARRTIKK